jgi:soluble lytic murein transglycosylase-like protein
MKVTRNTRMYSAVIAGLAFAALPFALSFALAELHRAPRADGVPSLSALELDAPAARPAESLQGSAGQPLLAREQRALAGFIGKRYRIAESAAASFVSIAYRAGEQHSVDPLLILAVMAVESRYNPVAESVMGAKGLMQVIPKWHLDKLMDYGGEHAVLEPEVNILVGTQILREYTRRVGDQEFALLMYAGAVDVPGSQYANKVLAERARLEPVRQRARTESAQSA